MEASNCVRLAFSRAWCIHLQPQRQSGLHFRILQKRSNSTATNPGDATPAASLNNKPLVVVETVGSVRMVGLNRPEKKNCINAALAQALRNALRDLEEDESIRAGVLYGEGGTFCSGYDLEEAGSWGLEEMQKRFKEEEGLLGPTRSLMCKKPLVAGISGYAVAGGFEVCVNLESAFRKLINMHFLIVCRSMLCMNVTVLSHMQLALFCDMRAADENAVIGVFNRRFGVPLVDGGTVRLPRLIGLSRALDIILSGRPITAKEGREIGLLFSTCSPGCAVGQAYQMAQQLCKFPPRALLGDRLSASNSAYNCGGHNTKEEFQKALRFEQKTGLRCLR